MAKMCFQFLFALLVALQVGSNVEASSSHDVERRRIDEDMESLFDPNDVIEMPYSCKGQPFCFEKGDNYPDEMIDRIVENLRDMELENPEARVSYGSNRGSNGPIGCKTSFTDNPIYYITDTNNQERVVIQSLAPKDFRQQYSLTWCSEEVPTSDTPRFLKAMKCVNQTMDLDFFVLSENMISENPKITIARATIPVCCRCQRDNEEYDRLFEQERLDFMNNKYHQ